MPKPKVKLSYRKLKKLYQELEAGYQLREQLLRDIRKENYDLHEKLKARVDTTMIEQRIKLASNLGQMMNCVCDATRVIIGKEIF